MNRFILEVREWASTVSACKKCDISDLCNHKVLFRKDAKLTNLDVLFVGGAPTEEDYLTKQPITGRAGNELDSILAETIDLTPLRYNVVNSVLCTSFVDTDLDAIRPPSPSEVNACRTHLQKYIELTKPVVVFAMGKIAARALKPICSFVKISDPLAILSSSHPDLDHARTVLAIIQNIKDISK